MACIWSTNVAQTLIRNWLHGPSNIAFRTVKYGVRSLSAQKRLSSRCFEILMKFAWDSYKLVKIRRFSIRTQNTFDFDRVWSCNSHFGAIWTKKRVGPKLRFCPKLLQSPNGTKKTCANRGSMGSWSKSGNSGPISHEQGLLPGQHSYRNFV